MTNDRDDDGHCSQDMDMVNILSSLYLFLCFLLPHDPLHCG